MTLILSDSPNIKSPGGSSNLKCRLVAPIPLQGKLRKKSIFQICIFRFPIQKRGMLRSFFQGCKFAWKTRKIEFFIFLWKKNQMIFFMSNYYQYKIIEWSPSHTNGIPKIQVLGNLCFHKPVPLYYPD